MSDLDAPAGSPAWPDRWLRDAAVKRGITTTDAVGAFGHLASAWDALLAAGIADAVILELACSVSATRPAMLTLATRAGAALIPPALAERLGIVPLRTDGPTITVASANPLSTTLERELAFATRRRINVETASPLAIAEAITRVYEGTARNRTTPDSAVAPLQESARRPAAVSGRDAGDETDSARSAIALVIDAVFADALRENVSDIHFEPRDDGLLVRFRVDGALYDARRIPLHQSPQIVRRLKILATMDIADTLRPQDGRMSIVHEARNIDMRVSTLPLGGSSEKVVVRILDSRTAARDLDVIGFTPRELTRVKRLLSLPEGLILVTGPTGSGKTSTLYAAVRHVHRDDLNVVTVEDPIEYRIDGLNQVQVNDKARMTFAASLRSILRQDPDVVLVGEMRDAETASIAVKASMTGHLVLSTLHASDALSTLDRLYGMEIDTGALAGALKGIIGQRLVRTLCDECAVPVTLSALPLSQQQLLVGRVTSALRRPTGCAACRGSGYRGRTLVAEIFLVTPTLQRAIARRADIGELSQLARECGTLSMWESGMERVLSGMTSLYELLDNVAAPITEDDSDQSQADVDALLAQLLARPTGQPPAVVASLPTFSESDIGDRLAIRGATASRQPARGNAGLRVLLVDDVSADRRQLADALAAEGFTVLEAADGEAALAYAGHLQPDLLITEIALPRLDAVGLLQALRSRGSEVRVFVHTRQTDQALHAWLRELGALEVFSHSMDARVLAARLRATSAVSAA